MNINIACCITLLRILLTPVVVMLMLQNSWTIALMVFLVAVATDVIDGFVARKLQQSSKFGQLLDPVADKILLGTVLYTMLMMMSSSALYAVAVYFLLCKELILLGGGGLLWFWFKIFIPPSVLSRAVSLCEVIFVLAVLVSKACIIEFPEIVLLLILSINVVLSVWLLVRYAWLLRKTFKRV